MNELAGKVAIVTGASKGIGAGIAKGLAAAGASVVVNYASSREGADRVAVSITLDRYPEIRSMMGGTLDDKSKIKPSFSVWCSAGQPWLKLPEGITCFADYPDGTFGISHMARASLLRDVSAIHRHGVPGDKAHRVRAEPDHGLGNLLRFASAADRMGRHYSFSRSGILAGDPLDHWRLNNSRADRIHANA
jgi:short chain dehydrogenase